MPQASTPPTLAITGDANLNPLNNATATIANGSGAGNTGSLDLGGGVRGLNIGNGTADVDVNVTVPVLNGGLVKTGAGTLRLSNNNTLGAVDINAGVLQFNGTNTTGPVTVNGGTLGGTGSVTGEVTVNNGGHLAPGASIESLGVGALTINTGAILDFELAAPDTADRVDVTGLLTLNGGSIYLVDTGGLAIGTYTLLNYGTLSGSINALGAPFGPSNFAYHLFDTGTSINLQVSMLGDFNYDGSVDTADYAVWRTGLGTLFTPADFDVWRAHFGQSSGSGLGAGANVSIPEPASWGMLFAVLFSSAGLRRR
jgi:fibronectin-binding autotransporter adhesin